MFTFYLRLYNCTHFYRRNLGPYCLQVHCFVLFPFKLYRLLVRKNFLKHVLTVLSLCLEKETQPNYKKKLSTIQIVLLSISAVMVFVAVLCLVYLFRYAKCLSIYMYHHHLPRFYYVIEGPSI